MQRIPEIIEQGLDGSVTFNGKRTGWDTVRVAPEGYVCELTCLTPISQILLRLPPPDRIGVDAMPSIEIRRPAGDDGTRERW